MSISADRRHQAFAESITFATFVYAAQNYAAEFDANYAATRLTPAELRTLDSIAEPIDVLAIVEDWCPDVVANLPILARIADDTSKIRLHVLVRNDSSRDVADAYPYEGRSHIPTYVFSDYAGVELGVIVERTPVIRERVDEFLTAFFAGHPDIDRATFPAGLTDQLKSELTQSSIQLRRNLRDLERSSFVAAIAELAGRSRTRSPSVAASIAG